MIWWPGIEGEKDQSFDVFTNSMQDAVWQELVGRIKDTFEVVEEGDGPLEDGPGQREYIIFQSPGGKMMLERVTKPVILGQRGMGGKRVGAGSAVSYEYSATEETQSVALFQRTGDGWNKVDLDAVKL